jgi:hypothetical protein
MRKRGVNGHNACSANMNAVGAWKINSRCVCAKCCVWLFMCAFYLESVVRNGTRECYDDKSGQLYEILRL